MDAIAEEYRRREIEVDGRVAQRGQHGRRLRAYPPNGHEFTGAVVYLEQPQTVFVVGKHHEMVVLGTARVPSNTFYVRQVFGYEKFVLQMRRAV